MELNHAAKALFKTVGTDGTSWLFFVSNQHWVITCDGNQLASGDSGPASLRAGLKRFLSTPAASVEKPRTRKGPEQVQA